MMRPVHAQITRQALTGKCSALAVEVIIRSNVGQDSLRNQLGHNDYHFDDNAFAASRAYIEAQRRLVRPALERGQVQQAWQAFGRLTHTAQDFYAHSNYVDLWLACQPNGMVPGPAEIDPLDDSLVENPSLRSGKMYYPWGAFSFVPGLKKFVIPRMPRDSHAAMNLDSDARGPMFEYAFQAAIKRTRLELRLATSDLTSELDRVFRDIK